MALILTTNVETLRKPSTGLKLVFAVVAKRDKAGRDTQKTQHGIETKSQPTSGRNSSRRDTQKTQHGIETCTGSGYRTE